MVHDPASGDTSRDPDTAQTYFGFEPVTPSDKARRVRGVFDSVTPRYDIMNDVMSLGMHRLWKRVAAIMTRAAPGHSVLDLATGSGDLAALLAARVGPRGRVIASDINGTMLARGRDRLTDGGYVGNVAYVQADAERLPFEDDHFHRVTIGFGLRNCTDIDAALRAMHRVLKPAGLVMILEFSRPACPSVVGRLYDAYSFEIIPRLGAWLAGDADSYRYLVESIRMHPDQETLRARMAKCGFIRCDYLNLGGGIVTIHRGYKA